MSSRPAWATQLDSVSKQEKQERVRTVLEEATSKDLKRGKL
jgi:hypothetical protein